MLNYTIPLGNKQDDAENLKMWAAMEKDSVDNEEEIKLGERVHRLKMMMRIKRESKAQYALPLIWHVLSILSVSRCNSRSPRSAPRATMSNSTGDSGGDGESDQGDPPGPSLTVPSFQTFPFSKKLNSFPFSWVYPPVPVVYGREVATMTFQRMPEDYKRHWEQKDVVLGLGNLQSEHGITQAIVRKQYGVMRLASRISELKKQMHYILSLWNENGYAVCLPPFLMAEEGQE